MTVLRPGTSVEEIYLTLRERINDGVYPPGVRMSQSSLAAELNVSRTPLREALQRLAHDGLLVAQANRGMEVAPIDINEIEQFYAIRLLVEPPTITAILGEVGECELAKMDAELDAMEAARFRIRSFQEAHMRFHELILQHYPPAFAELTQWLHLKIYRHQRLYFSRPQVPEDVTKVDRMFLEAARCGDEELCRALLEFHMIDAAIGLVSDSDPDHRYHSLLIAARGQGIVLDAAPDGALEQPARITFRRATIDAMPSLATTNLVYEGAG